MSNPVGGLFERAMGVKCIHQGAHADPRCVSCGAMTRSHKLSDPVSGDPVVAVQRVQCPNCGDMVMVPFQAMMCHKCFEAGKKPEPEKSA